MVQTANEIFRDFETDGVMASGRHEPKKSEIRPWGTRLENLYSAAQAGGGLAYETKAAMDADLAHDANQVAWVMEDPTAANNGIYQKVGASGSGSWNRLGDLPYSYIKASNAGAGTANAIVGTTSIPIPSADGGALIALPIVEDNTASPVTVSFNGGAALTVKTSSGNDISVGGLMAGMIAAGYVSGTTFRLLTDQAGAAIVAAAEAAAARAEAAAAGLNLPSIGAGDAGKVLTVKEDESGYDLLETFIHAGLYGAVGDAAQRLATVTIANGGAALTAAPVAGQVSFAFTAGDVGKCIVIDGAGVGGEPLITTISAFVSATEVTLTDAASTTVSGTEKYICYGTDNKQPLQDCLDAISPVGACLFIPSGFYLSSGKSSKTLAAGGATGKGVAIFGAFRGNTTIYSAGEHVLEILGPNGTWASHFSIGGIRFSGAIPQRGNGLKACGLSHSTFDCYFDSCATGLDLESVLISEFPARFYNCVIGARSRKSGYHGGSWGASGCNANKWTGAFTSCVQFAADFDTFQSVYISAHCEGNGENDIAGGGVSNTNRGGFKFLDPEGMVHLAGTFEGNGTIEGGNIGFGPVEVITSSANAGKNWTLLFDGYFRRTANPFFSAIYVNQDAAAGMGHIVWNGHLENNEAYTTDASRRIINATLAAENLAVTLLGGHMDGGDVEFAYLPNVRYTVVGTTNVKDVTVGTLPNASANEGRRLWASDLTGGAGYVVSDGTTWKREATAAI